MSKVFSFVKPVRWLRILTVFLAGVLLFFSTACSGGVQAKTLDKNPRPEVPDNAVTSPYQGGMNDFSDVDPRANTSATNKKADALIDRAERNVTERTGNPVEAIKRALNDAPEAGENLGRTAENIGDKAKSSAQNFGQGTKRGIENVKENSQDAAQGIPDTVNQAKRNAENTAGKVSNSLRSGAQQAAENTKQAFGSNPERID